MTEDQIRLIISDLWYQDWDFHLARDGDVLFLQCRFFAFDPDKGDSRLQHGRKWLISPHMTESEIVQTAWLAVKTAIEHEAREAFTYRRRAIFGPHLDVRELLNVVDRRAFDVRS